MDYIVKFLQAVTICLFRIFINNFVLFAEILFSIRQGIKH